MWKLAAALLVCLTCAGSIGVRAAHGQDGGGLYEPFPEPASVERAQEYVEQLGIRASIAELRRGRSLDLPLVPAGAVSSRATAGAGSAPLLLGWLVAGVVTAGLATSIVRRRH